MGRRCFAAKPRGPKALRETEIKKLNAEHERIQKALDTLYDDRIELRIDLAFFERRSQPWRDEQSEIRRDIERHKTATESFMEVGVKLIELSQRLHSMFVKQPAHEKRRLLDFVLSNSSWKAANPLTCLRLPSRITLHPKRKG